MKFPRGQSIMKPLNFNKVRSENKKIYILHCFKEFRNTSTLVALSFIFQLWFN